MKARSRDRAFFSRAGNALVTLALQTERFRASRADTTKAIPSMFLINHGARALLAVLACAVLAACGKSGTESKSPSQVAVKVNGEEITVHQVNQALARAGRIAPEQAKAASRQVLEQLVDQQLLVQKASEAKLDRNPEVMASLDAARRQILAQAYMERSVTSGAAKPGADEIRKFYDAKPELFAERRIYRLQELVATVPQEKAPALLELVGKSKNLNDIVIWLRSNDIKFNANSAVRPVEQLPLEALPMLGKMKDGDIGAAQGGGGRFTIVQRVAAPVTPLTVEEATPYIEQFLFNQRRGELAGGAIKQLRQSAKMEYVGEFAEQAGAAPAGGNSAATSVVAPVAAGAARPAEAPGTRPAVPAASGSLDQSIEKGLKGLK